MALTYDTTPAGTILDRDKEISSKQAYEPEGLSMQYNAALYNEFSYALWNFQKQHDFLNRRTITQYMVRNQLDVTGFVNPARDPYDWRNRRRSTTQYDKTAAILSFFVDLNFQCEPVAQNWLGKISPEMGEVSDALLQHANILDHQSEKEKLADYAMLVDGTVAEDISWVTKWRVQKKAPEWNPTDDPGEYKTENRWVEQFEGVESRLMKLNRVLLGDISKMDIRDQPYIFKEYVISYDDAYSLFHGYKNWKFVLPYDVQTDQWTDTDTDIEIEQNGAGLTRLVRVRVYENLVRNEYALFCNRVRMTPVGLKMPNDRYSITWQQGGLLNHHFAYGRSFVAHLRQDVAARDVLYSLFLDQSRQGLEPPMKSNFKAMINRHMFRPGQVTSVPGMLEPLIPANAYQNFAAEAIQMLESSIDKASISPIFQGQDGSARTKYEVEQLLINSIRTAAMIVSATVNRRRQKAEAMFSEIVKHYPAMSFGELSSKADTIKRFMVNSEQGTMRKEVMFQSLPDKPSDVMDLRKTLTETEDASKKAGTPVKRYLVDPDKFTSYDFVFNFRVNPQQRDSKATDMLEIEKKYNTYMMNPMIDPSFPTKMLLRANGDDVDEALKKPDQMQPQQPGQPQPGQPMGAQPGQPLPGQSPQLPPNPMQQVGGKNDVAMQKAIS